MIRIVAFLTALLIALPSQSKDHNRAEKIIDSILSEGAAKQGNDSKEPGPDKTSDPEKQTGKKPSTGPSAREGAAEALTLKTAEDYYNSGMTEEALSSVSEFLKTAPAGPLTDSARVLKGKILLKKLNYNEAVKELSLVTPGSGEYTAALTYTAEIYRQKGERARALEFFLKAASVNPGHELAPGALLNAAKIHLDMKNGHMAVETAVRLIRQYPDRNTIDEAWYLLARTFETDEKVRDLETARRLYKGFLKKASEGEPHFKGSPLIKRVESDLNYIERKHFRIY